MTEKINITKMAFLNLKENKTHEIRELLTK